MKKRNTPVTIFLLIIYCIGFALVAHAQRQMIWRINDNAALHIYTSTISIPFRYTLMHDPQYRLAIAWQNVSYNQPPHPDFYLGEGMQKAPSLNIVTTKAKWP